MNNGLTTQVVKINFKWLLEHCTDREFWKSRWRVFDYDNIKIDLSLNEIDISRNMLTLRVECIDRFYDREYIYIPLGQFNETVFNKSLKRALMDCIIHRENSEIEETDVFKWAYEKDKKREEEIIEEAKKELDDLEITKEEIRDAYIGSLLNDFDEWETRNSVCEQMRMTLKTSSYAMLGLMFHDDDLYQQAINTKKIDEEALKKELEVIYE